MDGRPFIGLILGLLLLMTIMVVLLGAVVAGMAARHRKALICEGPRGPRGSAGITGLTGATGVTVGILGRTGPEGPTGAPALFFDGIWNPGVPYIPGDIVVHNNQLWIAVLPNENEEPGTTPAWVAVAPVGGT